MKAKAMLAMFLLFTVLLTGCGGNGNNNDNNDGNDSGNTGNTNATEAPTPTTAAVSEDGGDTDVITTASIVDKADAFVNAIGPNGTWIIAVLNDLTIDQDLVLDGEFKNGKKDEAGKDQIQRKIALYAQDENRTVTARYTLTAPKITIKSPNARIQSGTFKGDVIVDVDNFQLVDATVDGNVYFTKEDYKNTFTMDATSKVTGKQEVQKQQ